MPRKPHIVSTIFPYHVSVRTNNKDWFQLPMKEIWDIFSSNLYFIRHAFNLRIHSFVLMSNHFHLLVTTPEGNLSAAMQYFLSITSKEISRRQNRTNHNFKQKYFRSVITNDLAFQNVYKYIYRNPVRAGITENVEDYPYSTLRGLLGFQHLLIPVNDDFLFSEKGSWAKILDWLNEKPQQEVEEAIKKGLLRREFKIGPHEIRRTPIPLEEIYL